LQTGLQRWTVRKNVLDRQTFFAFISFKGNTDPVGRLAFSVVVRFLVFLLVQQYSLDDYLALLLSQRDSSGHDKRGCCQPGAGKAKQTK
jgi:hypothetical protein